MFLLEMSKSPVRFIYSLQFEQQPYMRYTNEVFDPLSVDCSSN